MLQLMLSPSPNLGSDWRRPPLSPHNLNLSNQNTPNLNPNNPALSLELNEFNPRKSAAAAAASAAAAAAANMKPASDVYPSPVEELDEHDQYVPNAGQFRFLVVDDNEINLRIFQRVLLKIFPNASIDTVQDSTRVSRSPLSHYDVVFLDIEMPEVTGIDIATWMRASSTLDNVGLVAVTTRHSAVDRQLYAQCGFDLTIPKPIYKGYRKMLEQIEQVLDDRRL